MKHYRAYRRRNIKGRVFNEDAIELLTKIKSNSIDLIFLDPPFNLGKQYNVNDKNTDNRSVEQYTIWMYKVFDECNRILKDGGALYLYHLPQWAMRFGSYLEQKLTFVHWISIAMKNGFVRTNKLYPANYTLLFFSKGSPNRLNRPKINPQLCKSCGGFTKDYGGYKKIIEEKGINLSDFWDDLSPVRHKNNKLRVQNQLPILLTDRIVQMSGEKGEIFLDPFAGTGTGVISAIKFGMRFLCNDNIEENCILINKRIESLNKSSYDKT